MCTGNGRATFIDNSTNNSAAKCLSGQSCTRNDDQSEKSHESHKYLLEIPPEFAARPDVGLNDRQNTRHAVGSNLRRCVQKFMKREVLELYRNTKRGDR